MATESKLKDIALDMLAHMRELAMRGSERDLHIFEEYGITIPYRDIIEYSEYRGAKPTRSFVDIVNGINIDNRNGEFEARVIQPLMRKQGIYF